MRFNEKVDAANGFCLYVLRHSGFMENKRRSGKMQKDSSRRHGADLDRSSSSEPPMEPF